MEITDSPASVDRTSDPSNSCNAPEADLQVNGESIENTVTAEEDVFGSREEDQEGFQWFCCPKGSKTQILTLVCISFVNFAGSCSFSVIAPFFPKEALQRGASQVTVGFVFSCFAIVSFLSAPIFGKYITYIGSRFMLITGMFVGGCCSLMFGFSEYIEGTSFVVYCFVTRTLEAFGVSAYITAGVAILTHAFPNNVAKVMGALEGFNGIGLMSGPALGGLLYDIGGYKMPFLLVGGVMLCSGVVVWNLLPQQADEKEEEKQTASALLSFLKVPTIALTCGLTMVTSCNMSFLQPILEPYLSDQFKTSPTNIGLIFVLWGGVYTLAAPAWGFLADRKKAARLMIIGGMSVLTVSVLMIGPSPLLADYLHILPVRQWVNIVGLVLMALSLGPIMSPIMNEMLWAARVSQYYSTE
ncbi:hypothetical protein Bbelb_136910 [Branchiostoma belcheri]|nr:hypothetical protein Bbelb_136910 [Branchiostoma belcheri]